MTFNFREMSWSDVRDQFRKYREDNERRSDEVIQLWEAVLENRVQKTGNERHLILEQVILAALDTSRFDIAGKCIEQLSTEFPDSMRVMKFEAMRLEAMQMYDEANDLLDEIIAKDETNAAPRKRKIAILKAKGKRTEAIKELSEYLKTFMSDQEAWHELYALYLAEGDYSKAVFCLEEVLLHNPHSHLIQQRIAEIRYTMGGIENVEIARTYYSQALKLNPNNLRALYGLYLCCSYVANSRALVSKRKEAQKMAQWALENATMRTTKSSKISSNDKLISVLESTMASLDIKSN
ncbi:ER membrane protein complex subunit 2-like [Anastrepha obliqua]|uniref:ER membrane protein complex subunit 2-like n=1 Tax=Anastrepha ludens TaxID=28586 RepID=UPI0023AE7382|nr:ER membrane protein complex subunit 2-like [Anastrepha ludens]XP_054736634.1 ER membrane protein complex subunit 2-like [Anastrepha obliqua]